MVPRTPKSPVELEAATFLLDRAAHTQFSQFVEVLRAEREKAVQVMVLTVSTEGTMVCKGVVQAYDDLLYRITHAEEVLNKQEARKRETQERAR